MRTWSVLNDRLVSSKIDVLNKLYMCADELHICWLNCVFYIVFILECAKLFHTGGARLILCGNNWEKLETLSEQLMSESDPTLVSSELPLTIWTNIVWNIQQYLLRLWLYMRGDLVTLLLRRFHPNWWSWTSVIWRVFLRSSLRSWSVTDVWMSSSSTAAWRWKLQYRVCPSRWTGLSWTSTTLGPSHWLRVKWLLQNWLPQLSTITLSCVKAF